LKRIDTLPAMTIHNHIDDSSIRMIFLTTT
jgi:hypothetical protein